MKFKRGLEEDILLNMLLNIGVIVILVAMVIGHGLTWSPGDHHWKVAKRCQNSVDNKEMKIHPQRKP